MLTTLHSEAAAKLQIDSLPVGLFQRPILLYGGRIIHPTSFHVLLIELKILLRHWLLTALI